MGLNDGLHIPTTRTSLGLATTDSPTFAGLKLSGLTDGFIPKHTSDAVGLEDSTLQQTAEGLVTASPLSAGSVIRYQLFTYFV